VTRALALLALLAAPSALAETPTDVPQKGESAGIPLPFSLGGPFALTDQHHRPRTEVDPHGHLQLVFFGYAVCESICSIALPQMATLTDALAARGVSLTPVMITIDPERDTPEAMTPALAKLHPRFVGLTGPDAALSAAWRAFGVERSVVFEDPAGGAVFAHGSLLYLLDGQGKFLTVLPPILSDDRMIEIIAGYAART
jgi:protein SCO1/2